MSKPRIYIPGTDQRYSIDINGVVVGHYRYGNNGTKQFRDIVLKKFIQMDSAWVTLCGGNHLHKINVNTTMIKLFKIKRPDNQHFYDVICKDGNSYNNSRKNIGFKIRMIAEDAKNFYPQPFYNKHGDITHKICCDCGTKKAVDSFAIQKPKKSGQNRTIRNCCNSCRSRKNWAILNSTPEGIERAKEHNRKWSNSKKGRRYRYNYQRNARKNLTDGYVAHSLFRMRVGDTRKMPGLLSAKREQIRLLRTIKNHTK